MQEIFIGRQTIYDRQLNTHAYELLYRDNQINRAQLPSDDLATAHVVQSAFMDIGIDNLVGAKAAFINMPRSFIAGDIPLPFTKDQVVLEMLESIAIDEHVISGARMLVDEGYSLALDDFVLDEKWQPLLEIADIVKLDIRQYEKADLSRCVDALKRYDVQLLAEKVETHEEYEFCKNLGFAYFQGYFLCRPQVIQSRAIATNRATIMQLLAELNSPNIDVQKLQHMIGHDLTLSYKLLRYLNSSFFGLRQSIDSVNHAVVYLGLANVKKWLLVIALSTMSDKPSDVTKTALIRAKMCELLSKVHNEAAEIYFTVGMLSVLDAMMDQPLADLLASLPLSTEVADALTRHEGKLGATLACVLAYERADWAELSKPRVAFSNNELMNAYLSSLQWADAAMQEMPEST